MAHIKTVDEHGATVGEHIEGYTVAGSRFFQVISGNPDVHTNMVEETFGMLPLSIDCQEGPERRRLGG